MKLEHVLLNLNQFDREAAIYAAKPWCRISEAFVDIEPDDGTLPCTAGEANLKYFLEIHIALEHPDGWIGNLGYVPSPEKICERLIY